ncbi:hypothetical protein NWQ34_06235 [Mycoplasmopsis felis]|uniref:hypothetical protein n=1 Tax=Mycoplasmopsis felis TaxID=33923 RepID=UPI0021DF7DCF|nr:hypothetical protein [Mycoplasmopsis felis]MCU9939137.1 hypothetical protein [Mycoplasmopsis felis]
MFKSYLYTSYSFEFKRYSSKTFNVAWVYEIFGSLTKLPSKINTFSFFPFFWLYKLIILK